MQSFIFSRCVWKSFQELDSKRLWKNFMENWQILHINLSNNRQNKWFYHLITRMWRGHERFLINYLHQNLLECKVRGIKTNYEKYDSFLKDKFLELDKKEDKTPDIYPEEFTEDYFRKMRIVCYKKGAADSVVETIRKHWKVRSLNPWLEKSDYPKKNLLYLHPDKITELQRYAQTLGLELLPNYYEKFKPE